MKRFIKDVQGQGLVEYSLIVLLVTLVFWVAIKNTNIGGALADSWTKITTCVTSPFDCENK
jgi:Flp pilus assembly pilin Flp